MVEGEREERDESDGKKREEEKKEERRIVKLDIDMGWGDDDNIALDIDNQPLALQDPQPEVLV